jgi:hypothetical protein
MIDRSARRVDVCGAHSAKDIGTYDPPDGSKAVMEPSGKSNAQTAAYIAARNTNGRRQAAERKTRKGAF